ncbi:uncharacterized protein [Euwallacea fornicatus]|uniref:uncharacterized protein n=1 Tax=Euwallacea fornicatus TaxID=995702 RepID=UPI0033906705
MVKLQKINKISSDHVQTLIHSIDTVLFDIDGVLAINGVIIPGSDNAVAKFRQLGKKIGFVTNNALYTEDKVLKQLELFKATEDEIINPNLSLLQYLKKIDFKGDIYAVAGRACKNHLRNAGYNIIEYKDIQSSDLEESTEAIKDLIQKSLERCKNVKVIYLDTDLNICQGALEVAKTLLYHMDGVQLLTGMCDDLCPIGNNLKMICAKYHINAIEKWTCRTALRVGKPSNVLAHFVHSKYNISDNSRVLMVGDNVETDIAFGALAGYKTCLVLSGIWTEEMVNNWTVAEELKPDFVVNKLGDIYSIIKDM